MVVALASHHHTYLLHEASPNAPTRRIGHGADERGSKIALDQRRPSPVALSCPQALSGKPPWENQHD